jgi:hypothetical protein
MRRQRASWTPSEPSEASSVTRVASLRAVITLPGLTDHVGPERLISLAGIRSL